METTTSIELFNAIFQFLIYFLLFAVQNSTN